MVFKALVLFGLLINLSQSFAQEFIQNPFVERTNLIVDNFVRNTAMITAARHQHYAAVQLLHSFLLLRPKGIDQPGYANNVEQSQKVTGDIDELIVRMTTKKQDRLLLKDDLALYMTETDGPFNAANIRKEVSHLVELQDQLIMTTESYVKDKQHVNDVLQPSGGYAPAPASVRQRMHDSEQAIARMEEELDSKIATISDLFNAKPPSTLQDRAIACWNFVMSAIISPAK